ncbi:hypothetical protein ABZ897_35200 [Nonomuraea sp. NPDC046802]|uniref:hypothetical protein n=1 Tax=Nonomuraea sp. NPDC046802 TaxID=3154919 RepID=UPI0033DAA6DC
MANLALLYGMRTATAILAAFGVIISVVPLFFGRTIAQTLRETAVVAMPAAFSMGMASAVLRARQLAERVRELRRRWSRSARPAPTWRSWTPGCRGWTAWS